MSECTHSVAARDFETIENGACPICLRSEVERLRGEEGAGCGDCRKPIREACQCSEHLRICEEQQRAETAERERDEARGQLQELADVLRCGDSEGGAGTFDAFCSILKDYLPTPDSVEIGPYVKETK